ncbi:MAG: hypothetical protein ABF876_07875 [Acetobacter aceti]|uniref:DUF5666 domain-containing protein n=1 Tax=Acetobacter aceti TaxID=435 RepID=A0A1U9KGE8_ACEAC|nr:hypothetical protein [Acetobacter aceti]AQS84884.1 hypothetical protein A0U92_08960 [Acetobacter aceti]
MNSTTFFRSSMFCRAAVLAAMMSGCTSTVLLAERAAAQSVITSTNNTVATVESVDATTGEVLLRAEDGELFTLDVPVKRHALPHLDVGDRLKLRSIKTLDATLAAPDSPAPESTTSTARGYANRHPHGTLISFRRRRVSVVSTDVQAHTLTVIDSAGAQREVVVKQKIFLPMLAQLKKNDKVDVTTMDAVSFTVLNRVVAPNVSVQQQTGATGSVAVPPQAPVPAGQ